MLGLLRWLLTQNGLTPERLLPLSLSLGRGFDRLNQARHLHIRVNAIAPVVEATLRLDVGLLRSQGRDALGPGIGWYLGGRHFCYNLGMSRGDVLLRRILQGRSDANIRFEDLRTLLTGLGFEERIRGSHHCFVKPGVEQLINVQREGDKVKPYQVRQVRSVILRNRLGGND